MHTVYMSLEFICFQSIVIHSLAPNLPGEKNNNTVLSSNSLISAEFFSLFLSLSLYSCLSMFMVSILFLFNLFLISLPNISCSSRFEPTTTKKPHSNNHNNNNQIHLKPIKIQFDDVVFLINSRKIGFFRSGFCVFFLCSYRTLFSSG